MPDNSQLSDINPINPQEAVISVSKLNQSVEQSEEQSKGLGLDHRQYVRFDKIKALDLLLRFPNHVGKICQALGVNRATWHWNIKTDLEFATRVEEVRQSCADDLEETLYEMGKQKSSFTFSDRIAYLRAHRPELYDRAKVVKIEGYKMSENDRSRRINVVDTVIEAEVAKSYLDRKEQRERRQQIKASERAGGDASDASSAGGSDAKP